MPAGTEVCVVKTLLARVATCASSKLKPSGHQDPNALQREECRVPLIHVIYRGLQPQQLQRAETADAQHDLLADALVLIAGVELAGDIAMRGIGVLRDVGIQQIEIDAAYIDAPDLEVHRGAGQRHGYGQRRPRPRLTRGVTGSEWKSFTGVRSCCHPSGSRVCWKYPLWYSSPTPTRGTCASLAAFR